MVDFFWTEKERQSYVPVSLLARAKDGDVVHDVAFLEDHDRRQCRPERSELLSVNERSGRSIFVKES